MQTLQSLPAPWWKFGHVWLVIAGPAIVVVAGIATAVIAVRNPDPVLTGDHYRRGTSMPKAGPGNVALIPAVQGRNHAATPSPARER